VLAASAVDLVRDPELVRTAQAELARQMGGKPYQSPLTADAKPVVY
jgi:hypothetical protein